MASRPDIEQIIAALIKQVVVGKAHLAVTEGLVESDPVVLRAAATFFAMTIDAHLFCAQMFAAKLYDKTRGALTLETLLLRAEDEAGSAKYGSADEVRQAVADSRRVISTLAAPINRLTKRRNLWLAHTDPRTITDPVRMSTAARLSLPHLGLLLSQTGSILNEFSRLFRDITGVMELVDLDDYSTVMEYVARVKCEQVRAYEAEFKERAPFPRPRGCE